MAYFQPFLFPHFFARRTRPQVALLCMVFLLALSVQAQTVPKPAASGTAVNLPAAKSKPVTKVDKAAVADGFKVAPVPTWVQAVTVDAALVEKLPKAALHVLLTDRQVRVERDQVSRFQHVIRQINESSGLEAAAQVQIEFDP
ncbi:MAG: hypothetical protein WCH44_13790, partial [Betaproteobacteria bacterium]